MNASLVAEVLSLLFVLVAVARRLLELAAVARRLFVLVAVARRLFVLVAVVRRLLFSSVGGRGVIGLSSSKSQILTVQSSDPDTNTLRNRS